jgi:hypothetical protein
MVTGWWDLFVPLQLRDFAAIRAAGGTARITVGPWMHGEPGEIKAMTGQDIAWLEHHLNGGPLPSGPPVRVFLQQAGTWLEFGQWPPPGTVSTAYYLRGSGRLTADAEPGDARPDTFVYDPADPTPSAGGPLLQPPGKQVDNRAIEARPDVLTYTTDPLAGPLDLVGPVSARIFVRTGRRHADLFVRVCDVDEKGVSRNIVDGIRRLSPQSVRADDVQAGDDQVLAVEVELYPTAYRVQAGHRIRVQVSGGAFPRFARNFGTGQPFASATSAVRCRFEIHHGSRHPSCVLLSVLPGAAGLPPRPERVPADEAQQPGLGIRVTGYLDPGAVLAGGAHDLLYRLHPAEELGAEARVQPVVLAGGPGQIPGVHEHVGGVELVDRGIQGQAPDVRVGELPVRRGRIVQHRLHAVAVDLPRGDRVLIHRRSAGQVDAGARHQERGEPFGQVTNHVAGGPAGDRRWRVPGAGSADPFGK